MTLEQFNPNETICDRCSSVEEIDCTQSGPPGQWENCTLCNECYAEELIDSKGTQP